MQFTIAIQPDDYGHGRAYSPMWTRLLQEAGHEVRVVNVYSSDILDQVHGCHGFMWRHGQLPNMRQIARRLLPVFERELGLVVYPDQNTCWHYDDKITQRYLFDVADIPTPKTWVWYDKTLATEWSRTAEYPLVIKLWSGAVSQNVGLISSRAEAKLCIDKLFDGGVHKLADAFSKAWPLGRRRLRAAVKLLLTGSPPKLDEKAWELHKNYILFQQFLPDNAFDTRVVVIGNRAFAFRRFNRPNDFRASGSKNTNTDPTHIDLEAVRLGFRLANRLKTQSIAIDCLRRGDERVVAEMSYTYPHSTVRDCPGHWELVGDPNTGELIWQDGQMWPEEAQIADFLKRLNAGK